MPNTPNYSLPYPAETYDADVPVDMEALAEAVDGVMLGRTLVDAKGDLLAGTGADTVTRLPVGADGTVLGASSTQPSGLTWVQLAGAYVPVSSKGAPNGVASLDAGGKVPNAQLPPGAGGTIYDAKGDIVAASANDTPARFAVGADGQVLQADSTQPQGLKWGTPAAGGAGIPPSIVDAKGDLIVGTADDTVARLARGTDGQVLSTDSAQAAGLKWIPAPSGGGGGKTSWWENVYNPATPYVSGDVVTYNGVTYLAVNPSTGQTPPTVAPGAGTPSPQAKAQRGTVLSVATGTLVAVPLDTELYDTDNIHDNVTNNTRLTCRTAGTYIVSAYAQFAANATGLRLAQLNVNGNLLTADRRNTVSTAGHPSELSLSAEVQLAVGDYIELIVYHEAGVALNVAAGAALSMARVTNVPPSTGSGASVGFGTALPASPTDGDEYVLVDSLTAPTYQWRFKYIAGITDAYKWVYIGGAPAANEIAAAQAHSSTVYVDLTTVGPQFTIPRSGIYQLDLAIGWCKANNAAVAALNRYAAVKLGAAATSDNDSCISGDDSATPSIKSMGASFVRTLVAADVVKVQYRYSTATGSAEYGKRMLKVTPMRVS